MNEFNDRGSLPLMVDDSDVEEVFGDDEDLDDDDSSLDDDFDDDFDDDSDLESDSEDF